MTQQQAAQLERATQIAERDGLTARKGITRDGKPVWAVLSRSATRKAGYPVYHLVTVEGSHLACDCPGSWHGRVCAHRAAVRAAIEAELKASARKAAEDRYAVAAARRESAPLARDNRPISIFK